MCKQTLYKICACKTVFLYDLEKCKRRAGHFGAIQQDDEVPIPPPASNLPNASNYRVFTV